MPFFRIKASIEAFIVYTVEADSEEDAIKKWENDEAKAGDLEADEYATEEIDSCVQFTPDQESRAQERKAVLAMTQARATQLKVDLSENIPDA